MNRWRLTEPEYWLEGEKRRRYSVIVSIDAVGPDDVAELQMTGDPEFLEYAEVALMSSQGYGGHGLEKLTTPLDLACAMRGPQVSEYEPEVIESTLLPPKDVPAS